MSGPAHAAQASNPVPQSSGACGTSPELVAWPPAFLVRMRRVKGVPGICSNRSDRYRRSRTRLAIRQLRPRLRVFRTHRPAKAMPSPGRARDILTRKPAPSGVAADDGTSRRKPFSSSPLDTGNFQ